MRAIQISTLTGPADVQMAEVPEPAGAVQIDVAYAGVTYPDVLLTRGLYQLKPDPPFIPGSEVCGVVRADGHGFRAGQPVAAFCGIGGFAQTVAVDPRMVLPLPENLDLAKAAALPMNYLTMDFALRRRAHMRAGQTVLVQGAAGGIGTAAIQLAKAMGAHVIAVVSSQDKVATAVRAGADEVVLADGFRQAVTTPVDIVVDPVGGDRFTDSLRCLAPEGQLLVIGFTAGDIPTVKVNRLLLNNISVVGVGWGAFWMARPDFLQEQWHHLLPLLDNLDPVIDAVYDLEQAPAALAAVDERRVRGKVLLRLG